MTTIGFIGLAVMGLLGTSFATGCSQPCCTVDSYPINLLAPAVGPEAGGLQANARYEGNAQPFTLAIDTGSPLTIFRRQANEKARIATRNFDILDAQTTTNGTDFAVRAQLRGINVLPLALADPPAAQGVLGGDFLRSYSVQLAFGTPSLTLWSRQGTSDAFLANAGFAVLHFDLLGGGELTATSQADFLGFTGPVEMPATRIVLRGCGAPEAFDLDAVDPKACGKGCETTVATGTDLALVVATGIGPLVLSQSAWNRMLANLSEIPPPTPVPGPPLSIPSLATPLAGVLWSSLPRLAFVDQEADASTDPGACVELGHARRLEWVEHHQSEGACIQPCDTDLRDSTLAQNAAAYVEIGGAIPVAIIPDDTPLLQGLRAEIRPVGPEVDGLLGAGVLAKTSLEIDYRGQPGRALFSCAGAANGPACWTSPRCPRLANQGDTRACFGEGPRNTRPPICAAPVGCG